MPYYIVTRSSAELFAELATSESEPYALPDIASYRQSWQHRRYAGYQYESRIGSGSLCRIVRSCCARSGAVRDLQRACFPHPELLDGPFDTRADAFQYLTHRYDRTGHDVVFLLSEDEQSAWRTRESERFDTSVYMRVPWRPSQANTDTPTHYHYAHMSLELDGKIAYTPNDEFGAQDRQIRIKPGKYLAQFYTAYSEYHADWIAACSVDLTVNFARTADEIESVYLHGPRSCMGRDRDNGEYFTKVSQHPVRAYAGPDLAVAYLGEVDAATARALVFPERKIYGRTYGDTARIQFALKRLGYTSAWSDRTDAQCAQWLGARMTKIQEGNHWLLPYLDHSPYVAITADWLVFNGHSEKHLACAVVSGHTTFGHSGDMMSPFDYDDENEDRRCAHCNDYFTPDSEDDSYCASCEEDRFYCDNCDTDCFDQSHTNGDSVWCDACRDQNLTDCARSGCHQTFCHDTDFDRIERRQREDSNTSTLCARCARTYTVCPECDDVVSANDGCDCQSEDDADTEETETESV